MCFWKVQKYLSQIDIVSNLSQLDLKACLFNIAPFREKSETKTEEKKLVNVSSSTDNLYTQLPQ